MNKNATSSLLVALMLSVPVLARAQVIRAPGKAPGSGGGKGSVSAAAAKAAIGSAVDKAEGHARQLSRVSLEVAPLLVIFPYGNEADAIATPDPSPDRSTDSSIEDIKALLKNKTNYWRAVDEALKAEKAHVDAEMAELRPDEAARLAELSRESIKLSRQIRAVDKISGDIADDEKFVDGLPDSAKDDVARRAIITRKGEVLKVLIALK